MLSTQAKSTSTAPSSIEAEIQRMDSEQLDLFGDTLQEIVAAISSLSSIDSSITKCGIADINVGLLAAPLAVLVESTDSIIRQLAIWKKFYDISAQIAAKHPGSETINKTEDEIPNATEDTIDEDDDLDNDFDDDSECPDEDWPDDFMDGPADEYDDYDSLGDWLDDYFASLDDCPPPDYQTEMDDIKPVN